MRQLCPEAAPAAVVAGDICLDRMTASLPLRAQYRRALGVGESERLVTVSSTWSADSVFGRLPGLCRTLMQHLPAPGTKVAAILHPNVWTVHGTRQVTAWLSDCLTHGLLLIPPQEGWRATMVASDWVLGDHGSTTAYAAAIGRPVTLAAYPEDNVRTGSLADLIHRHTPALRLDQPLGAQADTATSHRDRVRQVVSAAITSRPGRAAAILRSCMYRLLNLPEPACGVAPAVVPLPTPIGR